MQPNRITTITILAALAAALGLTAASCEMGPFHCEGHDPTTGGPLCFCDADGLLCGHDPFRPCSECPLIGGGG